ncbi:uncharacterized protein LOC111111762 [Crassostrea virginica]
MNGYVLVALSVVLISGMLTLCEGRAAWRSYYYPQTGSASSSGSLAKTSYKRARSSRKSSYKNYDNQYRPSRRFYPKPTVKDNYKPDPTTPVTAPPDPYYTTTTPSSYPDQYRPTLSPFAKQFSQNMFHMTFKPSPMKKSHRSKYSNWAYTNFNRGYQE